MVRKCIPNKKRVATSYEKLSSELRDLLSEKYPEGYLEHMLRIEKPNGEVFYAVMLETDEVNYLVKVNVKIDEISEEEEKDDDVYIDDSDEIKGADEIIDSEEDSDD